MPGKDEKATASISRKGAIGTKQGRDRDEARTG